MSDEAKAFMSAGQNFAAHDTVRHSQKNYVRGIVHVNSAEGFSDRGRRTVVGVFHHISTDHANIYLNEIGIRWSQRTVAGQAIRQTARDAPRSRLCGIEFPPRCKYLQHVGQSLDVKFVEPKMVESSSSQALLSLVDNGGFRGGIKQEH
jgi:uncharacterized C2H2 Zn-finger protein